jgi:NitT/TauT family transport system substrate-binding protein
MRLINKLAYCLAAAVPVVALAGCSSGGSATPSGPPPEQSTIVLDAVPTGDEAGIYIAQDDGFFKQQGLTVKIVPVGGGELAMPDLQDNKAQLVAGNYVSFILAQMAGSFDGKPISMRMIADCSQMQPGNQALFVMPGSPFTTVAELAKAHATVGVNTLHNIGSVLLGSLLTANGYDLGSIKQVALPLPDMPELLAEHKVEAAWMPEPFATMAEQQYGAVELADFDQGSLENFPIGTIVGNTKWIQTHPNTVAAFLRAFQEGQQIADTDREAVEQALVQNHVAATAELAATMTLDTYPLVMDVPVMQRVPDAMYEFGVTKTEYDIAKMIQPEPGEITMSASGVP